jgi:nucleotide-binding universal stress UspA family protein
MDERKIMFKTILVPTDGSVLSDKAVQAAIHEAKLHGGKVVGISVAEPYPYAAFGDASITTDWSGYEKSMREAAQHYVDAVATAAKAADVPCETLVTLSFSPYEEIIKAAKEFHCDVIFMASHGRKGLNRLLIGSETQKVLAHTVVPVLVIR